MVGKPLCSKCGERHWNMIRCADVPEENAREHAKAEAEAARRVVPQPRVNTARPPGMLVSRNFVQQAPGVYRRRRRAA